MQALDVPVKKSSTPLKWLTTAAIYFFGTLLILVTVGILFSANYLDISVGQLIKIARADTSALPFHQGRINFLLLGIGGGTHEGTNLTDTMMFGSVDLAKKDIAFVSIPRDVWVAELEDRINTAYAYAEAATAGSGLASTKTLVSGVVGQPIDYGGVISFEGFKQMVDALDGIDVNIAETFTDANYPIAGLENDECNGDTEFRCRYESVTFTQGVEHMNGDRALKYVRSRHADGEAGTDFSRAARQQAVIKALEKRLLEPEIRTDVKKLQRFFQRFQEATITDMHPFELLLMARLSLGGDFVMRSSVLTQEMPEKNQSGLLIHPEERLYGGRWVLIPKRQGYSQIHEYVHCFITLAANCEDIIKRN